MKMVHTQGPITWRLFPEGLHGACLHIPVVRWNGGDGMEGEVDALGGTQPVIVTTA